MRLLEDQRELEARASAFVPPDRYRDIAFELIQRTSTATALYEQMELQAVEAAGLSSLSKLELAAAADEAHRHWEEAFRLPTELETRSLVQQQIDAAQAYDLHFGGRNEAEVLAAMTSMSQPWLDSSRTSQSVLGLFEMQTVGAALQHSDPFAPETADLLRGALGDWRDLFKPELHTLIDPVSRTALYYERGYNPDLAAFPRPAFVEGLRHAGLDFDTWDEQPSEANSRDDRDDEEAGFARNLTAFDQLQRFEVAVRQFIDARMTEAFGPNWISTHAPEGIGDNWREKQAKHTKITGEEKPLIEFADFTDYRPIIERKQNWKAVFAHVFNRQSDIQESFQRLYPVRIATMHARMITQDDEMLLTVEIRRILKAIRKG